MQRPSWKISTLLVALLAAIDLQASSKTSADNFTKPRMEGPFFAAPEVIAALDCPNAQCEGPLSFLHLMRSELYEIKAAGLPGKNPFVERAETRAIVEAVRDDISNIRVAAGSPPDQLDPLFLTSTDSRVQLVGVINRMDRQFHASQRESACGEISLIYRFAYSLSRLPVTMNVIFPAAVGTLHCKESAQRWLDAMSKKRTMKPAAFAAYLVSKSGPLEHIKGGNIARLELNMQTYRKPGSVDTTDFGSEATYLIRVFRWNPLERAFQPSTLPNEINRHAVLCDPDDDPQICNVKRGRRSALVDYLQKPRIVEEIDRGRLDIPQDLSVLSLRAISVSPGGQHRSSNQPYWNAAIASDRPANEISREQVISDAEIGKALDNARAAGVTLEHIGNADDFRQRLNDSTCSGCHQARAIAGFHFPGFDSADTQENYAANAVYLAGSPQFYADQPRRMEIVRAIAKSADGAIPQAALVVSYSARPDDRFSADFKGTAYVGGWGAACSIPTAMSGASKRQWSCQSGLTCQGLFQSDNAKGIGTCVPDNRFEIGDHMQLGQVLTTGFGHDVYFRSAPEIAQSETNYVNRVFGLDTFDERKTTIDPKFFPPAGSSGNSYYASHQEFYVGLRGDPYRKMLGECTNGTRPKTECYSMARDRLSGGFPSGMLRLSECQDLPSESTCGMVASSGFNNCMVRLGSPGYEDFNLKTCFEYFTSYAGMRACDIANPCRDDYICVAPTSPSPKLETERMFRERLKRLQDTSSTNPWKRIIGLPYDSDQYGQKQPDSAWVNRNDTRGICIPPYFVFQFRSDRHPNFGPKPGSALESHAPSMLKQDGEF
ncbi:hypothetical protein Q7L38_20885 [Pseudomonas protegens]|uniref:hypothetical protein n=1 Tax=Pseudomonas protegens TaxID=380021 RepID=UPI002754CCF1|nr:hypothetical protein [Pseudomonas protegens]MDP9535030.1 hypothetical protein [Pseudomonas protegens]